MTIPRKNLSLTAEQYLAAEEKAPIRHEYVDGRIFAMTGTTLRHNIIAGNLFAALRNHVKGAGCRATMSDLKVRVEATNSFYYPDVAVSCGKYDGKTVVAPDPVLIVEVLSPSTSTIDRREKVLAYKQIASVSEYLIVYQRKRHAELHRRNGKGGWDVLEFVPGDELILQSIPCGPLKLTVDQIYEDVDWNKESNLEVHEESGAQGYEPAGEMEDELDW